MVTLEAAFEQKATEAFADDIYDTLIGEQDNLTFRFINAAHENLRDYGRQFDYDVEPIINALGEADVTRTDTGTAVRVEWDHEAAVYMEFGTPKHQVTGNPILSFVWEDRHDPPDWVQEQFEREGDGYRVFLPETNPEGLPEGRWIRDALRFLELIASGRTAAGVGA